MHVPTELPDEQPKAGAIDNQPLSQREGGEHGGLQYQQEVEANKCQSGVGNISG